MKRQLLLLLALAVPLVSAGGKYAKASGGMVVAQLLIFLLGTFIFSVIFWWTYLWIVEDKGKLSRKKK